MSKKTFQSLSVLLTSVGRKVSLVKAFRRDFSRRSGSVIAVDINPLAAALQYGNYAYLVPVRSNATFVSVLLRLCKKHRVTLIVPTSDSDLMLFARHRENFERIGTRVLLPDIRAVEICRDKIKFVAFCKKNGFAVPKTYSQKALLHGKVRFPVFIRGRFGMGSRGAAVAKDRRELLFYLQKIPHPIVQEYIRMKEYTIDLFADFDGRVISVVPRERITIVAGESFVGKTVAYKLLINEAIKIAEKLGLIGHNTIQCFFDGKKPLFIEVNPRYGGGASLGFAAGADTPSYLLKLLLGKTVVPRIGKFKKDLFMLRYTEDLFVPARDIQWKTAK